MHVLASAMKSGLERLPTRAKHRLVGVLGVMLLLLLTFAPALLPDGAAAASTLHVTDCADSGANTLPGLIGTAASGDTIVYDQDCTTTLTSSLAILKNLTIDGSGHTVILDGGGTTQVFHNYDELTIEGLTIRHGWSGDSNSGGAISNRGGTLTITNSTFSDNSAYYDGGAIVNDNGAVVTIADSTFSGNAATNGGADGGAIINYNGTLTITNSTFSDNHADSMPTQNGGVGGAVSNRSTLVVMNSTFSGNSASESGSGINNSGNATIYNTIVANSAHGSDLTGTFSGGNNLIDDMPASSTNVGGPALLSPLGDFGGPTQTFALLPGSPAFDAGNDAACANTTGVAPVAGLDQRGIDRPSGYCDIGAYESRGFTLFVSSGYDQSTTVSTPFAHPLVVTLAELAGNPLPGATITFTPNVGDNGQSATLSAPSVTDAFGQASATATANATPGSYIVTATAMYDFSVNVGLTNTPLPDTTPPVITPTVNGTLGSNGWYTSDVTVTWSVADAESTISNQSGCDPSTITDDTPGTVLTCTATSAGGTNTQSVTIMRDATAPTISDAPTTQPNSNGWYNGPVTIQWTCGDATSDIANCPADTTISADGVNQAVSATAIDNAGNATTVDSPIINIDTTAPVVTYSGNQGTYTVGQTVNISCTAADQPTLSGLASTTCADINQPAADLGTGSHTFSATAMDNAGNAGSGSVTFTVQVTTDSLTALTEQYAGNTVEAKVLSLPLKLAQRAEQMHNDHLKAVAVDLYIRLVHLAEGHGLSAQQAATLTQLAQNL